VVGSAIAPVIKVCANPETTAGCRDDMDVDAGRILEGHATLRGRGPRDLRPCHARRQGRCDALRSARPPGVHPHVQELRALGPSCLPAERAQRARARHPESMSIFHLAQLNVGIATAPLDST
jgi:altronate hydrolase